MNVDNDRHALWRNLLVEQRQSGDTIKAFCENRDVSLAQFYYYRSLFKKTSAGNSKKNAKVAPIRLCPPANKVEQKSDNLRVVLRNGMQCILPCDIDLKRLQQLVEVLLSC